MASVERPDVSALTPYPISTNNPGNSDNHVAMSYAGGAPLTPSHPGGPQKLIPTVVYCTTEDEHFPVTELCRAIPSTRGWQSSKHCNYPQQIGLRFDGEVYIEQIQFLSHESKISSRIEIHVAEASETEKAHRVFPPYEQCAFRNMGYVAMKNNLNSQFKSGEMRSCLVRGKVLYIKLLLWEPHRNSLNFYEQVGLASIICVGNVTVPFVPSTTHPHQRSTIGGVRSLVDENKKEQPEYVPGAMSPLEMLQMDLAFDMVVVGKIKDMTAMKEKAVQEENFQLAQRLKEQIQSLYPLGAQIQSLESRKKQATMDEDFQLAHTLKAEIEELRAAVAAMRVGYHSHHPAITGTNLGAASAGMSRAGGFGSPFDSPSKLFNPSHLGGRNSTGLDPTHLGSNIEQTSFAPSPGGPTAGFTPSPHRPQEDPIVEFHGGAAGFGGGHNAFDEMPAVASGAYKIPNDGGGGGGGFGGGGSGVQINDPGRVPISSKQMLHYDHKMAELITQKAPEEDPPDDIKDGSQFVAFDKMLAALGIYATCALFSRRYQLREAAMAVLIDHADAILHHCAAIDVVEALALYLSNPGYGLNDKVTACYFTACMMLDKIGQGGFQGNCNDILRQRHADLVRPLIPRLGDANSKVRGAAAALFNRLMHSNAVGIDKVCLPLLADKGKNFRLYSGKIDVIQDAILDVLVPNADWERYETLQLETLMKKAVEPAIAHQHIQVREKGYDLMCLAQHYYGNIVMEPHVKKLKPSQKKIFDERMGNLTKNGRPMPTKHTIGEQSPAAAASPKRKLAPRIRRQVEENRQGQENGDDDEEEEPPGGFGGGGNTNSPPASSSLAKNNDPDQPPPPGRTSLIRRKLNNATTEASEYPPKPERRKPPEPIPGKCQFCGLEDDAFFEHEELVQHFMSECPMLCTCPLCKLPVEIREIHWHLAEDCEFRQKVSQCPRCLETVRADELEDHLAKKTCTPHSEEHIICPLCKEKMPNGDTFWEIHIMTPPFCSANPRTSS